MNVRALLPAISSVLPRAASGFYVPGTVIVMTSELIGGS